MVHLADRVAAVEAALSRHAKAPSIEGFDWAVSQWPTARHTKGLLGLAERDVGEVAKRMLNDANNLSEAVIRAVSTTPAALTERVHAEWLSTSGWVATSVRIGSDYDFVDFAGVKFIPGDERFAGVPAEAVFVDERANVRYLLVLGYREWSTYSLKLPLRLKASSLIELANTAREHLAGLARAAVAAREKEREHEMREARNRAAQRVITAAELAAVEARIREQVKAELATATTG
jgi:hypothetical protein